MQKENMNDIFAYDIFISFQRILSSIKFIIFVISTVTFISTTGLLIGTQIFGYKFCGIPQ